MSGITINSNLVSLKAQRQLSAASDKLSRATERLASGLRINRASDDAAGLSISTTLNARARVYSQAVRNANDGLSALSIAEGAVGSLTNVLTRIGELAEQAANGTFSLSQRQSLANESDKLIAEYNRTVSSTNFNGLSLLDGSMRELALQLGFGTDGQLNVGIGQGMGRSVSTGSYSQADSDASSGRSNYMELADLNGDGYLDRVSVGSDTSNLKVALGDGAGGFAAETVYTGTGVILSVQDLVLADFNGDGRLDIAVADNSGYGGGALNGRVRLFMNSGTGTFSQDATTYQFTSYGGASKVQLSTGDLNGDGIADLAVGSSDNAGTVGTVTTFLGNGSGLTQQQVITGNSGIRDLEIADFNGDGRGDLAYIEYGVSAINPTRLVVAQSALNGTLATTTSYAFSFADNPGIGMTIGDFNRDGIADIATISRASFANPSVQVFSGKLDSSGNYSLSGATPLALTLPTSGAPTSLRAADTDGDGFLDIVVGNFTAGSITTFKGHGDGVFDPYQTLITGFSIRSFAFGDTNRDGVLDIVTGNDTSVRSYLSGTQTTTQASYLDLRTVQGARSALDSIQRSLLRLADETSRIGASQSRLATATANLLSARDNYLSAESRIKDADIASESAETIRQQTLQQVSASILAQANQMPSLALRLLAV